MKLLVSIRNAEEAIAAAAGGADVIDAKEPRNGALGAVSRGTLTRISRALPPGLPLSVALGDATHPDTAVLLARRAAELGAAWVKLGLARVLCAHRAAGVLASIRRIVDSGPTGLIAVAYADAASVGAPEPYEVIEAAAEAGAAGVLLDTALKDGGSLFELHSAAGVGSWVAAAHARGLQVALAGRLKASDMPAAHLAGADVVGVRGAACDGGRLGTISAPRVLELASICRDRCTDSAVMGLEMAPHAAAGT